LCNQNLCDPYVHLIIIQQKREGSKLYMMKEGIGHSASLRHRRSKSQAPARPGEVILALITIQIYFSHSISQMSERPKSTDEVALRELLTAGRKGSELMSASALSIAGASHFHATTSCQLSSSTVFTSQNL